MKKFIVICGVVLVVLLSAVYFIGDYSVDFGAGARNSQFNTSAKVYGEVAPGTIFTTSVDVSVLLPDVEPVESQFVTYNEKGELLSAPISEKAVLDYRAYPDGLVTYFLLHPGDRRRGADLWLHRNETKSSLAVKDNDHTDPHTALRDGDAGWYLTSYKLHTIDGVPTESFFIERQNTNGEVTFTWESLDHIPLTAAEYTEQRPYWIESGINDYFHGNSLTFSNDGNLLISGRHVNQVLKVSTTTGEVIWKLGGKDSDFVFVNDPRKGFSHQHSVHQLENGNILLYDNGNLHSPPVTRMAEYKINEETMTAELVWSYSNGRFTLATGSVQRLPNGNTLIGWGIELDGLRSDVPRITEIDAEGNVVLEIFFPDDAGLYNAYKL